MDTQWFDALFNRHYDNVVNCIVDYVNYGGGASSDGGVGDDESTDDADDNNDDNDDDKNDLDEEGKSFWSRELDCCKLVLSMVRALVMYYIYKEHCIVSYNTIIQWLNDILHGHWKRYVNMFRIDATTF
jgi:hypothetical protein